MNTISIDQKPVTSPRDSIQKIVDEHLPRNRVLCAIELNGETFNISDRPELMVAPIGLYQSINLVTKNRLDLIFESLDSCSVYLDILVKNIKEMSLSLQQDDVLVANSNFSKCIEGIELFVDLMTKINSGLRAEMGGRYKKSQGILDLEIHLLSILKAIVPAREKNDIIMLCDLLEYELADNLTQWKIKAIPELKKIGEN